MPNVVDGVPCGDVKAQLVYVLLAAMPPGPEKLLAIPTGLMTDRSGVDLLVEAGRAVIIGRRSGAQALTRPCGQQVSANDQ